MSKTLQEIMTSDIPNIFLSDFTVDGTYTPQGGGPSTIKVVFENQYQSIEMLSEGVGVESTGPAATCKTSDVSTAKHGDTLAISGKIYYINGVQPDGTGLTRLLLSEDQSNV